MHSHNEQRVVFSSFFFGSVAVAPFHLRGREALPLHGYNQGGQDLYWEIDKEVIGGWRLLAMLHSPNKGHDDSLHKGEGIDIFFLCFLWFPFHCLGCSCTLVSVLIIKGTAPCDKRK